MLLGGALARRDARGRAYRDVFTASPPSSIRSCSRDAPLLARTKLPTGEAAATALLALPLGDRLIVPARRPDVELPRPPDPGAGIRDHLAPVSNPADAPRDREHHREHRLRDAERPVDDPRVEVHVRVQVLLDEVLVLQRDLLEAQRELEQRRIVLPEPLEHAVARLANDRGARIVALVNAVPEAHQPERIVLVLRARNVLADSIDGADLLEHVDHRLVRAVVRPPPEIRYPGRDVLVGIRAGAAREANRRCAAVLLVVGMQYEQEIERLRRDRIYLVLVRRHREE